MSRKIVLSLCLAAAVSGCAMNRGRGPDAGSEQPEFVGRSLQVVAANGQTTILRFQREGQVFARYGEQETEGRWELRSRELCFTWRQTFRECWPYTQRFRRDRATTVRSDRGNVVQVTLR